MPILNYTTKVNATKTISEITQALVERGANKIIVDYSEGLAVGMTFQLIHNSKPIFFSMPANWEGVLGVLKRQKGVAKSYQNKEQSVRTAWRILKTWIDAQMAIIDADIVTPAQVFLPYAITKEGNTLYEAIEGSNLLLNQ